MSRRPDPPRTWRTVLHPLPEYPYFERPPAFDSSPSVGRLNVLKAAWTADAAMLAYGRSGERWLPVPRVDEILREHGGFCEVKFLGDWSEGADGAQGYFAERPDFAVLAFRGTEPDDWNDIASDLFAWPANEEEARVHRGFQKQLDALWPEAEAAAIAFRERSSGELFFTGHSLGAGLATIAASRFKGGTASLYAFGSPRVGNSRFCFRVEHRAASGVFRVVDRRDIVARIPPSVMGYEHLAASLYHIQADGSLKDRTMDWGRAGTAEELYRDLECMAQAELPIDLDCEPPSDAYDHGSGCYCVGLWNQLEEAVE